MFNFEHISHCNIVDLEQGNVCWHRNFFSMKLSNQKCFRIQRIIANFHLHQRILKKAHNIPKQWKKSLNYFLCGITVAVFFSSSSICFRFAPHVKYENQKCRVTFFTSGGNYPTVDLET